MRTDEALAGSTVGVCTDEDVVARVRAGDTASYEIIMRRYNQRLYRVAVAILRDSAEAEDVIQDAYVRAYQHLDQFAGRAPFSAWLTRITVHEALSRIRMRERTLPLEDSGEDGHVPIEKAIESSLDPEENASRAELGALLEVVVLALPAAYRTVIMLRDVEGLSIAEIASALDLTEENVKIRLHRGRAMARGKIVERVGKNARSAFSFMGARCDGVVQAVLGRLPAPGRSTVVQ